MSVTVNYKNNAIATIADGGTKTLLTSGTWLEDDIEIVDTTSGGGGAGAISVTENSDSHGGTVVTITGVDISNDTVTAAHLESGYTAHDAQGNAITGTYTLPTLVSKSITSNGTYNPSSDSADGYSSVTVNVPGWTKIAETTYSVNTTSTSAGTVATWATGSNALWTSDKWVYVRIRDTAGKRNGYFYGSDQYFFNVNPANGVTVTSITTAIRIYIRYADDTFSVSAAVNGGYGVFADTLYSDGRVRIRRRYSSTNSLTINGTFKVEVYLLDSAGDVSIFA